MQGPQGLFFIAGGRRDHIKIFITDLQKMRELYITLTCLAFGFLYVFTKEQQERQMQQAEEPGSGFVSEGTKEVSTNRCCLESHTAGWPQALASAWGELPWASEGGDERRRVGGDVPGWQHHLSSDSHWQLASSEALASPCLEAGLTAWSQGADGGGWKDCELYRAPSPGPGVSEGKGSKDSSLLVSRSASSGRLPADPHP